MTSSVITVARMPNSIVISNMMIRFGHHETIGMLPVFSGQASSVMRVSQVAKSETHEAAGAGDVPHPGGLVDLEELLLFDRLAADHRDGVSRQTRGAQTVHGALRRVTVGIEGVDGAHACVLPSACSR